MFLISRAETTEQAMVAAILLPEYKTLLYEREFNARNIFSRKPNNIV